MSSRIPQHRVRAHGNLFYSVTVESGTNQLHGSVYDNFVNTDLDARDFFTATRQIYHQNGGGFTLGGPVYIPKVYNGRNRTFFFFGHDLFYSTGAQTGTLLTIPTTAMRQGDFSNFLNSAGQVIPIFDPNSTNAAGVRTQFPGNMIPASRISQVSKNILAYMPQPDLPTEASNWYNRTGANPKFNNFTETARVDHSFSDKEKMADAAGSAGDDGNFAGDDISHGLAPYFAGDVADHAQLRPLYFSSSARVFPSSVEAKPHCGDRRWMPPPNMLASRMQGPMPAVHNWMIDVSDAIP